MKGGEGIDCIHLRNQNTSTMGIQVLPGVLTSCCGSSSVGTTLSVQVIMLAEKKIQAELGSFLVDVYSYVTKEVHWVAQITDLD